MHRACEDCDRLWQAYQEAIKDHVQLLEEYQAAIGPNRDVIRADFPNYTNVAPVILVSEVVK